MSGVIVRFSRYWQSDFDLKKAAIKAGLLRAFLANLSMVLIYLIVGLTASSNLGELLESADIVLMAATIFTLASFTLAILPTVCGSLILVKYETSRDADFARNKRNSRIVGALIGAAAGFIASLPASLLFILPHGLPQPDWLKEYAYRAILVVVLGAIAGSSTALEIRRQFRKKQVKNNS